MVVCLVSLPEASLRSDFLLDSGSLAVLALQVIQFGSSYATLFHYFDLIDRGRNYREDTLNANAIRNLPNSE